MDNIKRLSIKRDDARLKKDIGEGLLRLRAARGWTRGELAALLPDVTPGNLQGWEAQVRAPQGVNLIRIARLLDLDLTTYPAGAVRVSGVRPAISTKRNGDTHKPVISIAPLIFALRLQSGLVQKDFAARWDVALQTLRNWESGVLPAGAHIGPVAARLGLPHSAISLI